MHPTLTPATNIDEVLIQLDSIIEWAKANGSRLGYFPALYRRVTARVKDGIAAGEFEDGPRMEHLDVVFANRYLVALRDYWAGKPTTESWRVAFEGCKRWRPLVLQHLMAGMSAHIQLDLGVSAAEVAPGNQIWGLEKDFAKINALLLSLIDQVQDDLAENWRALKLIDWVAGRKDERLAGFGIEVTRKQAWQVALNMAQFKGEDLKTAIRNLDQRVSRFGKVMLGPRWLLMLTLSGIRILETGSIYKKIKALQD